MARRAVLVSLLSLLTPACLDSYVDSPPEDTDTFAAWLRATDDLVEFGATHEFAPTTGGSAPPICGDGRIDPGEACDLGPDNRDDGPCTVDCRLSTCGDGLLAEYEQCDLGPDNRDDGPCTRGCRLAACGDGILYPDYEQCDLGPHNRDDGPCTRDCRLAACGDGLLYPEYEQCDLGPDNRGDYAGCRPDCTLAPRCGDGLLQPEFEECDDGPLNGSGAAAPDRAPCRLDCKHHARLVFVTSQTFTANLGGLDGADLRCRQAAAQAGLPDPDRFRAWLSDDTGSPQTRFDHGPEFAALPYVRLDGLRIADDFDALIAAGPLRAIDITETGEALPPQRRVWSNTSFTGLAHDLDAHCDRWSSTAPDLPPARLGMASPAPADFSEWQDQRRYTTSDPTACAGAWRLYCFEQ